MSARTSRELESVMSWVSSDIGINSVFRDALDFTISSTFFRVFFGRPAASGHVFHMSFPELIISTTVFTECILEGLQQVLFFSASMSQSS